MSIGERDILVQAADAAEFSTMSGTPSQPSTARPKPIMIFDADGQRAHVHH